LALIIALHGGFGSATNLEEQSGLSKKADAEKFIVVYPEGIKSIPLGIRTWNAGWCCGYASNVNSDDIGFIAALLDSLENHVNIDTDRIYATGMSNGGFLTYRLSCELSERIAAFAPVAASMSMPECKPLISVPIIHFHSFLDTSIPYLGGVGGGVSDHYNPPADSVHNAFSSHNNCNITNDTILTTELYTYIEWSDCDCNKEIHYYITEDGGHSWPGGTQTKVGDSTSKHINATDLMWEFFQQYTLDCNNTSNIEKYIRTQPMLFPNPGYGVLNVKTSPDSKEFIIIIYNSKGSIMGRYENQQQINLENLVGGLYVAKIVLPNSLLQEKIILIK
jgi:polyhydroxybutyrate depolymerase